MADQNDLLQLLQQINARSGATVRPQVAPTRRTNAVPTPRPGSAPSFTASVQSAPNISTASVDTINAQNKLNAYSMDKQAQYPGLTEQIKSAEAGIQKPSGALGALANVFDNPISKALLSPLIILDTGRRGVISGVREIADLLDTDKKTKASLTDWFKQTKDPSYGFGTAFPMKGWLGRTVGLIGDIALDPMTWATLGGTVPESVSIRLAEGAAGRLAVKEGAEALAEAGAHLATKEAAQQSAEVSLRKLLGTKSVATAEGRASLAGLASRMGASDELVKNIAAEGRRAFRTTQEGVEMAQRLGLNRSGIYYFGSRVRVPFSGPIADMLETGIVKSRLGIMRSAPGEWISKNFTTAGTSSARSLKELKRGLALGKLGATEAAMAAKMMQHESMSRAFGAIAKDTFVKALKRDLGSAAARGELFDKDILEHATTVYKYLDIAPEHWAANNLPQMTETQLSAYNKIKSFLDNVHGEVEAQFKSIDPNFTLNKVKDYFPHMMTDEGYRYVADNSSKYAEEIRQYLKLNMTDPSASFKSRGLVPGAKFFGKTLDEKDIAKGIDGLNQIARDAGFKGNFFETDVTKVLSRYANHYAEQHATAEFMRNAIKDGILQRAKEMGVIDEDWMRSVDDGFKNARDAFDNASTEMRDAGSEAVAVARALVDDMKATVSSQKAFVGGIAREAGTPEKRAEQLATAETRLGVAVASYQKKFDDFAAQFAEQTEVIASLKSQLDSTVAAITQTQNDLAEFAAGYRGYFGQHLGADIGEVKIQFNGQPRTIAEVEKSLDRSMRRSAEELQKMESTWQRTMSIHQEINDILNKRISIEYATGVDNLDEQFDILVHRGTGDSTVDKVLDVLLSKGVKDAGSSPVGASSINEDWIGKIWTNSQDERIVALRNAIDPNGQLRAASISRIRVNDYYPELESAAKKLNTQIRKAEKQITRLEGMGKEISVEEQVALGKAKKLRDSLLKERNSILARRGKAGEKMIPGIRTRIARGLTVGDNMVDLREAAVWLILRDIKLGTPDFLNEAAMAGRKATEVVDYVSKNFGRYEALANSLRDAEKIDTVLSSKALRHAEKELKDIQKRFDNLSNEFFGTIEPDFERYSDETISKYVARQKELTAQKAEKQGQIDRIRRSFADKNRDVLNRVGDLGTHRETVQTLAANVSEYYLHRETVIQFRRLASALDSVGMKPTQDMYNRVLASVAHGELENVRQYNSKIIELMDVFKNLRDAVASVGEDDLSRNLVLRGELGKIFKEEAQAVDNPEYAYAVKNIEEMRKKAASLEEKISSTKVDIESKPKQIEQLQTQLRKLRSERDKFEYLSYEWQEANKQVKATTEELRYTKKFSLGNYSTLKSIEEEHKSLTAQIGAAEKNLSKIRKTSLGGRRAELIREFMPEMEAVWLLDQLDEPARLFYRDGEGQQLIQDVLNELRSIGKEPEWGKPITRKAKVVTGKGGEDLRGFRLVGGSESERLARIDRMQGNIQEALRTLREHYNKQGVKIGKGVTFGGEKGLTQTLGTDLANLDLRSLGLLKADQVENYQARYNAIIKRIKEDSRAAAERAKPFTGTKNLKNARAAVRAAIDTPQTFGFATEFSRALDYGGIAIDDFFAQIVGGQRLRRGTAEYEKIIRSGKAISKIKKAEFDIIDSHASYLGKLKQASNERLLGLRYLVDDPAIPTELLVEGDRAGAKGLSGSWAMNVNLRGQQAYADALEEHADNLLVTLEKDKRVALDLKKKETALRKTEREYDKLVGGPMRTIETPRSKRLQQIEIRNAEIQQKVDQLKATAEQVRAETMQREHSFAMKMAHFNRDDVNQMLSLGGPDMEKYHFSADEWAALWDENMPEESLATLRGKKGSLSRELSNLPKSTQETRWQAVIDPKITAKLERAQQIRDEIRSVDALIARHNARGSAMAKFGQVEKIFGNKDFMKIAGIDVAAKPHMSSADAIFAIGNTSHMTKYFKDLNVKFPAKDIIDGRHMMLDTAWKNSAEYAHLSQVDALSEQMNWLRHEQFVQSRDRLLARHKEIRDEVAALRQTSTETKQQVAALEEKISNALSETEKVYGPVPKAKQGEDLAVRQARQRAEVIKTPVDPTAQSAREFVVVDQKAIDAGVTPTQQSLVDKNKQFEEVARMIESLQFEKIVSTKMENQALDYISFLNTKQKALLREKMVLADKLAKEQGIYDRMATGSTAVKKAEERSLAAGEAVRVAQVRFDNAQTFAASGPEEIRRIEETMSDLRKMAKEGTIVRGTVKKGDDAWVAGVQQFLDDTMYMFQQINGFGVSDEVRRVATSLADARNEYMRQSFFMSEAEQERALVRGIRAMSRKGIAIDPASVAMAGGKIKTVKVFDDGFVQLSKYFPDIGVRKEVAEIYQNVHRMQQPLLARELSKFLSKYTSFFKSYATLSPGFHVRNGLSNGFMLFAAGGDPKLLAEGLQWSKSWMAASKAGDTFEEWIAKIPEQARAKVSDAFKAAAASGGGMTDDMVREVAPIGTANSRKLGRWIEQHSRFMLAYDGVASGMDMTTASARVKRFLIDYQDLSTADAYMRQIVPFWMWTSRNLPMQLQNMWLNPRAYLIYNSLRRNLEDKESDKPVPAWMRELGAFKLPFGKDIYATPDFGFNRVNQQLQELRDPARALANVNPLLRLPIELAGGRQLYSNRQFSDVPVEVGGGAGALLQPFLAAAGYGTTTAEGKKFVNDKAYYALRNLIPFLGTAERLTPSIQTYKERGYVNPLIGFLGIPGRQLTESEQQSELARRQREIQKIVSREKALKGNE